ncbi:MAG: LuxR family transcriptional regulator [Hyphomicrobiales bacterium]|nr:LuxR family transcriptional regulator [Hyphomicrobiales bacterium]
MRISEFIERSNAATSTTQLSRSFGQALSDLGYEGYAYGALTNFEAYNLPSPAVDVTYPVSWVNHYFERGYERLDPVVTKSPFLRRPFVWTDLRDLSDDEEQFLDEAHDARLFNGIAVPIHGPFGDVFVVSAASPYQDSDPKLAISVLHVLATQFHSAFLGLVFEDPMLTPAIQLSPRERECLLWSARGKSSWDIGMILNISEHTVNFHLKNAMGKLGAGNRILAIVKAIRMGLIIP